VSKKKVNKVAIIFIFKVIVAEMSQYKDCACFESPKNRILKISLFNFRAVKKTLILLISVSIFSSVIVDAQIDTLLNKKFAKITNSALRDTFGYNLLRDLCRLGPRLSGSENLINAENFILKKLAGMGLDTLYTQTFTTNNWKRGSKAVLKSSDGNEFTISALGGSIGTNGVIRAGLIEMSDFDELEKRKDEVKGKIVFFNFPFPQEVYESFESYGPAVNYRVNGALRAAKYGAVGVLIRSVASNFDDVPHTGTLRYLDTIPKIPGAALGVESAVRLNSLLASNAGSGKELIFDFEMDCRSEDSAPVRNIIAEIRGGEYPDDIIVVGAHIDSWDAGEGAHDDGAGVVQSVEVLHLIKKAGFKPKRTIRMVLFANEENGLVGARGYGKFAAEEAANDLAAIESDRGGFTPRGFSVDAAPEVISKMEGWLPYFTRTGLEWFRKGGSGADISQIKNAKALIGYVPDSQRYFTYHHSANDVFTGVDHRELELGSAAITILTMLISEFGLQEN